MAEVPCYCPHCGTIFAATNIIGGGDGYPATVHFVDSRTNCPNCGKWANIVDGEFILADDTLSLRSGPPLSRAIVDQLQRIAERVRDAEITPQQAVEEAAQIDPALGSLFAKYVVFGLPILLAILTLWQQHQGNVSSSEASAAMLAEMQKQTVLMQQHFDGQNGEARTTPADLRVRPEVSAEKPKSTRRRYVNRARRDALKMRRSQFGNSHQRGPR